MEQPTLFVLLLVAAIATFVISLRYVKRKRSLASKIKKIQSLPQHNWSTDFLQSKRTQMDPVADVVIQSILEQHEESMVNRLFDAMVSNDDIIPEQMPPEVRNYFALNHQLPTWADKDLIALGEQVYIRHGLLMSMVLSCKSMPECYACAKGAKVLYATGRLNDQQGAMDAFTRRIVETAQFVVNAMTPGGLAPRGKGITTALKVRLIHATIRYFLKKNNWDTALYDEPINQEDMAGTLMSFSALVLDGLKLLNVKLSDAEEEAYQHCWRIIGHFMGVQEDLLPNNVADARALGYAIMEHQVAPSDHGRALTAALIKFKEDISPEGKLFGMVHEMLRFMMGNKISDLLGVPPTAPDVEEKIENRLREWVGDFEKVEHRSILFGLFANAFGRIMLQGMLNYMNHQKKSHFYLPESLKSDWGVAPAKAY